MKLAHIVKSNLLNENGKDMTYKMPFCPYTMTGYTDEKYFLKYTNSTLLDLLGVKYIEVSAKASTAGLDWKEAEEAKIDTVNWFSTLKSIRFPSVAGGTCLDVVKERRWGWLYGFSNDEDGHRSLYTEIIDGRSTDIKVLDIQVVDPKKAPKDMRRVLNYYEHAMVGDVVYRATVEGSLKVQAKKWVTKKVKGEMYVVETKDGKKFAVLNWLIKQWDVDSQSYADGKMMFHPDFIKSIGGSLYGEFDRMYASVFGPDGLGKGVAQPFSKMRTIPVAGEDIQIWIITYGAKKRVLYGKFFAGILNYCHAEPARSDPQSLTNFAGDTWIGARAEDVALELIDCLGDQEKLKCALLRTLYKVQKPNNETFSLIQLFKTGISCLVVPGALGKVVSHYMDRMLDAEEGRVDVSDRAVRVLSDVDPDIWDEWGLPNNIGTIPDGEACCMDIPWLEGELRRKVYGHRQPNGHSMERADFWLCFLERFAKSRGRRIMFWGRKTRQHLAKANGADHDDHWMLYFVEAVVEMVSKLVYPVTEKLEDLSVDASDKVIVSFAERAKARMQAKVFGSFSFQTFVEDMQASLSWSMKIGQMMNLIRLDALLSGRNKKNMLKAIQARSAQAKALKAQGKEHEDIKLLSSSYKWLKARPEYILREQATNAEGLIDFTQQAKDLGQREKLQALIDEMGKMIFERDDKGNVIVHTKVFPEIWMVDSKSRVPSVLKLNQDFILAPSLMCDALRGVRHTRKTLEGQLGLFEFKLRQPLPPVLNRMYPTNQDVHECAVDLRKWVNDGMGNIMNLGLDKDRFSIAQRKLMNAWQAKLDNLSEPMQENVICEFWRITVDPRREAKQSGLPAFALMNNVSMAVLIRACKRAGLAGECHPMEFAPFVGDLYGKVVEIDVRGHQVYRKHDQFWIGTTDESCPNGSFKTSPYGYIVVKDADPSLQFIDPDMMAKAAVDIFADAPLDQIAKSITKEANEMATRAKEGVQGLPSEVSVDSADADRESDWDSLLAQYC